MSDAKPLIVGEANPYGGDPFYALYPAPDGCAGHRLCTLVLGLSRQKYLDYYDRTNLCPHRWSVRQAREEAERIWKESADIRPAIILLGRKVAQAFHRGVVGPVPEPFSWTTNCTETKLVYLPHPSGLCRLWNEPGAFDRARGVVRDAGALPE
jgi:hypothetical protein